MCWLVSRWVSLVGWLIANAGLCVADMHAPLYRTLGLPARLLLWCYWSRRGNLTGPRAYPTVERDYNGHGRREACRRKQRLGWVQYDSRDQ